MVKRGKKRVFWRDRRVSLGIRLPQWLYEELYNLKALHETGISRMIEDALIERYKLSKGTMNPNVGR